MDTPAPPADQPVRSNRLLHEKSPYLLQHAHNPVDWYPWGEEAFEKARREDKPIFLSVGYSTCHWCHVMAHESFENAETAAVMNELFVNVKLDREERPDVDRVYMTFVQATSGSGGWPMSVWLQPDLKPIAGGTYFPPDDRYGRRGFTSVCRTIDQAWKTDREKVVAQGNRIFEALRDYARPDPSPAAGGAAAPITDVLRTATQTLASAFDPEWGGFGGAPKFPRPVSLELLMRAAVRFGWDRPEQESLRRMVLVTLDRMAAGGMHDHLGGGFHRYSVDRFWHVPHFEKMLYDQAQLAVAYLAGYQLSAREGYRAVTRDILDYVQHDLRSPEGGFYCAEDADSLLAHGSHAHAEGAFYVWTRAEIETALGPVSSGVFCKYFHVREEGNAPDGSDPQREFTGKNILFAHRPVSKNHGSVLEASKTTLYQLRARRPRPHLDDKIVTAWNGLMISAFARAAQVLGDSTYLATARRAADFIRRNLYREDGVLLRSYRQGPAAAAGFADDYAFLIQGLLDLYEADFDLAHLLWAEQLQDQQDALFYDSQNGGYFSSAAADPDVLLRLREDHDGAEPSASSVSALNLLRLAATLGRGDLRARAAATVAAFGALQNPARTAQTMPLMLVAADALSAPPRQIVIAGSLEREDTKTLLRTVYDRYSPGRVLLLADGGAGQQELARRLPYLEGMAPVNGQAAAYVCEHGTCQLPTTDPAVLRQRL